MTQNDGYQPSTRNGAAIRADVVDVYVFTRVGPDDPREKGRGTRAYQSEPGWRSEATKAESGAVYFLQLLRSGPPLENTWHPVMGHVESGESSTQCAIREMREELALDARSKDVLGFWALEQVHPFYIAAIDSIVMSPRFCVEVSPAWSPRLNDEHAQHRWVREDDVDAMFMWPGQKAACREVLREIVRDESLSREQIRVRLD